MADSAKTETPSSGGYFIFVTSPLPWCKTDTNLLYYHATPQWVWRINCAIRSDGLTCKKNRTKKWLIIQLKSVLQWIPRGCFLTSHWESPGFLFRIVNSSSSPLEVSASSSWCLPISTLCCRQTSGFLLIRVSHLLTRQELFSPPGFSSMYSTVLGVFHPVHSLQPQWGHFNIIHFFRNTLQKNTGLQGENTQRVIFHLLLPGPFVPSQVIYMRPALTKLSF